MDRDAIILEVLSAIELQFSTNTDAWDRCWRAMADELREKPFRPDLLVPPFLKSHPIARWQGDWHEVDAGCVAAQDEILRREVFQNHLSDSPRIVELGAGSGRNIALLAEMCPEAELVASDASLFSRDVIGHISQAIGRPLPWVKLDMRTCFGWDDLNVGPSTTILTVHAMEQLGADYRELFHRIREAMPSKVVNIEPLDDLYDRTTLFDELAYRYHRSRGYLDGWAKFLKRCQEEGIVDIMHGPTRFGLGDKFHEAYSLIVWRPL